MHSPLLTPKEGTLLPTPGGGVGGFDKSELYDDPQYATEQHHAKPGSDDTYNMPFGEKGTEPEGTKHGALLTVPTHQAAKNAARRGNIQWEIFRGGCNSEDIHVTVSRIFGEGFPYGITCFSDKGMTRIHFEAPPSELSKAKELAIALGARSLEEVKRTGKRIPIALTASRNCECHGFTESEKDKSVCTCGHQWHEHWHKGGFGCKLAAAMPVCPVHGIVTPVEGMESHPEERLHSGTPTGWSTVCPQCGRRVTFQAEPSPGRHEGPWSRVGHGLLPLRARLPGGPDTRPVRQDSGGRRQEGGQGDRRPGLPDAHLPPVQGEAAQAGGVRDPCQGDGGPGGHPLPAQVGGHHGRPEVQGGAEGGGTGPRRLPLPVRRLLPRVRPGHHRRAGGQAPYPAPRPRHGLLLDHGLRERAPAPLLRGAGRVLREVRRGHPGGQGGACGAVQQGGQGIPGGDGHIRLPDGAYPAGQAHQPPPRPQGTGPGDGHIPQGGMGGPRVQQGVAEGHSAWRRGLPHGAMGLRDRAVHARGAWVRAPLPRGPA